ncbi:GATOR complex protein MIOS [Lamellibrachia satsuma]|nr:GATOR complex protein MIOS [Lamellibrachia satsuma]
MSRVKLDLLWSPNREDKFVTFGTELCLYKIESIKDKTLPAKGQSKKVSDETFASVLSVNSDNQYMKCLAWYPKSQPDNLLAVGLANGKVVLTGLGKTGLNDPHSLVGREFVPRHARQCHTLSWNPDQCNLLAQGLDKLRADPSILIWDVHSKVASESVFTHDRRNSTLHSDMTAVKPLFELAPSETCFSLSWFAQEPKTLVAGMNHKYLKIFDLKDVSHPQSTTCTKSVYGIQVDPYFKHRLASFSEGQVTIWDTRNFDKPVLTIQESKHIIKLEWSPTRCGLLACLAKDSPVIKLYDIQHTSVGPDELEPAVIERAVQPHEDQEVASFAWNHTHENRMMTISLAGVMKDVRIYERIAVAWSANMSLSWACSREIKHCYSTDICREIYDDISVKMRQRALRGYGIQRNIVENGELAGDSSGCLNNLWSWLQHAKKLQEETKQRIKTSPKILGVKSLLIPSETTPVSSPTSPTAPMQPFMSSDNMTIPCSDADVLLLQGIDGPQFRMKIYRSEERLKALQLCGWGFDKHSPSTPFIDRLEQEGEVERAAAVSVFTLRLRRAIQVLNDNANDLDKDSSSSNRNLVAMALSGFTDNNNALWKEMCGPFSTQLKDPYLRAMFAFLVNGSGYYDGVLFACGLFQKEADLLVVDRVAFACMYLPDAKLSEYIDGLMAALIGKGSLDGIFLTGLTVDGLDLLERYVDMSGDIQTASCVVIQALPNPELSQDSRIRTWIENYRALLDSWRLWHQRAEFDVYRNMCENTRPEAQVFVSCNFCGKSVGYSTLATRNRLMFSSSLALKSKFSSCPGCRKPLPRCALCLINMGTAAGTARHKAVKDKDGSQSKLTQLSDWFTWCQTCRHGGHADHMTSWFSEHSECPVSGCLCKCMMLDAVGSVLSAGDTSDCSL